MTYIFAYDGSSRPAWQKILTASSGETFTVNLVFENLEDRDTLSAEQVYQHIDNLVSYIKDVTTGVSPIYLEDSEPGDGWHLKGGWGEVEWAKDEVLKWWSWAYYNDAFQLEDEAQEEEPA